jgi:hypothetical protein
MAVQEAVRFTLTLTDEERQALLALLEHTLEETHVERRRTESPSYHEQVVHQESVLLSLKDKVLKLSE